jgi:hypothetical protein
MINALFNMNIFPFEEMNKDNNKHILEKNTPTIHQGLEYKEKQKKLISTANKHNSVGISGVYGSKPDSLIETFVEGMNENNINTGGTVATLPPKATIPSIFDTITKQIMSSTDPVVKAEQTHYQGLLNQFNNLKTDFNRNIEAVNQDRIDYINATSPSNAYMSKFIQEPNGTIYYVTQQGVLLTISSTDILNSVSGQNGCPKKETLVKLGSKLKSSTDGRYKYTQSPDNNATFVIGENMQMYQSCGNEGKNVRVSSAWNNSQADYQGAYSSLDIINKSNIGAKLYGGQKYNKTSCLNQAINDNVQNFGLTNYNNSTGLSDCVTMKNIPTNVSTQEKTTCSNSTYIGGNKTNVFSDSQIYGPVNGLAVYNSPQENVGKIQYVGVFNDSWDRAMPLVNNGSRSFNYESCLKYASGNNTDGPNGTSVKYPFFGLQWFDGGSSAQCSVSNVTGADINKTGYAKHGQIPEQQVGIKGKDGYTYGSSWQNAVYTKDGKFLGVFNDGGDRAIKNLAGDRGSKYNSYMTCRKYAMDHNYKYFGLQYFDQGSQGAECWTTNDDSSSTGYSKYGKISSLSGASIGPGSSNNNLNPEGQPQPIYGGAWQNSVFSINYLDTAAKYNGCFNDNQPFLGAMTKISDNSSFKDCSKKSEAAGYTYFGLQAENISNNGPNKSVCYGSNDTSLYQKYGTYNAIYKNNDGDSIGNSGIISSYKMKLSPGSSVIPNENLIGTTAFVNQSGKIYSYPLSSNIFTNEYQLYPMYDSNGYELQKIPANQLPNGVSDCGMICNNNPYCSAYVFNNSDGSCDLKNGKINDILTNKSYVPY